ncbi:hypothetical protein [Bathymodiolus thermophilus thioautotrophic gill symbiont]|uniref:hypothetical protein n=1 Tax=Bathymodiolus thermophilus thioautotrophic gill symbiont TaxID=2360 RepID=UPI00192C5374|nr:hypothetical protein [Bathymodiolus thermophilus thioautotrophic gill symbiont]
MPREERLQTVPYGEVFLPKARMKRRFPFKSEDEKGGFPSKTRMKRVFPLKCEGEKKPLKKKARVKKVFLPKARAKTELFHTKIRLAPTSREGFVTLPSPLPHKLYLYTLATFHLYLNTFFPNLFLLYSCPKLKYALPRIVSLCQERNGYKPFPTARFSSQRRGQKKGFPLKDEDEKPPQKKRG